MRVVHAYIRRALAARVIGQLQEAGCRTLSILEVRGLTPDVAASGLDPSVEFAQSVEAMIKLEIVGSDEDVARWADVIARAAHTGKAGDGLVAVLPVHSAMPISSGKDTLGDQGH
ncbi:MAG: P-II family nitrogen regulator [Gemmatimonadota bacterium]